MFDCIGDAVDISMHRERRTKRREIAVPKAAGLQPQTCRLQTLVNKCGMRKRERIKIVLSAGEAPEARISRKYWSFFGEVRQGLKLTLSRRRLLHNSVRESSTAATAFRLSPRIIVDFHSQSATAAAKLSPHPLTSNHDISLSSSLLLHVSRPLPSSKSLWGSSSMTEEQRVGKLARDPIHGFRSRGSRASRRIV